MCAPTFVNIMFVVFFFFLCFAILGVQLFKGKFYSGTDADISYELSCVGAGVSETDDGVIEVSAPAWMPGLWSFDNLGDAVITLFEVSTLEMWLEL